jgi:glycosyltransferase involved in cell wall biosynthesis
MKGDKQRSASTQVIIAALNEEEGIGLTITELLNNLERPRLLVVDGKSVDRTVEISEKMGAEVVFQDQQGKGDALAKALEYLDRTVDFVVFTDADYTYPGGRVPEMIKILEANPGVGMVCGNRFNHHLRADALGNLFYFGNRLIAFSNGMLSGIPLSDPLTGLRVVRASILGRGSLGLRVLMLRLSSIVL